MSRAPRSRPTEFAICENCGHGNDGAFCSECGQAHGQLHHRIGEFIADAADAFVHLDSKSVKTLIPLLFQPGKLSADYLAGKRASSVAPLRLYLYISFFFFLILGAQTRHTGSKLVNISASSQPANADLRHFDIELGRAAASQETESESFAHEAAIVEQRLANKHGARRWLSARLAQSLRKLAADPDKAKAQVVEDFMRVLPKVIFLLVPLFGAILFALFRRSRAYYVEHLIVALHLHAFLFVLFSVDVLAQWFRSIPALDVLTLVVTVVYAFLALRRVYGRALWSTAWRSALAGFTYLLAVVFASLAALAYIFVQI